RLCRGGSRSLTFQAVVHRRNSRLVSHHAHEKEFRDGRLRESKPQQMGVQISCGLHSQVPQEDAVRRVEAASRGSVPQIAMQKECRVEEGHLMPDHVHMMISIPPNYAVSQVIGYIKGEERNPPGPCLRRTKAQLRRAALLGQG